MPGVKRDGRIGSPKREEAAGGREERKASGKAEGIRPRREKDAKVRGRGS